MHLPIKMESALITGAVALLTMGCAAPEVAQQRGPAPGVTHEKPPEAGLGVVQALVEAFNRHDPEQMAALVHQDFEYLSVTGKTVSVDATGREALKKSMASYFQSVHGVKSVIEHATVTGPYVAFRERVSWMTASGERSQASMGIYEVRDGLVQRVWYFPAVERSGAAP
jgi:uncharacterized protein (TIGR02246 family)